MSGSGGSDNSTTTRSSPSGRFLNSTKAWMKIGAKNSRHKHLETIKKAARGVVLWLTVNIVSFILFSTQPQGIARAVFNFIGWQAGNMALLSIVRYYRTAIIAGALKKKSHDTARGTGELSGEVSNSSVVPVASDVG